MGSPAGVPWAAVRRWSRADVRARWRALVVLGVLAGLSAGLAMASLAGARRASTALPRLRDVTRSPDAIVFPGQVGVYETDWSRLEAQPFVEEVAPWNLTFGTANGEPGATLFVPTDRRWLGDVDKPVVQEGRMFDPAASDELVVMEGLSKQEHIGVGSVLHYQPYGPQQDDTSGDPPNGPQLDLKVVGVIKNSAEFLFTDEMAILSPGVTDRYGSQMALVANAYVRLRHGAADLPRLQRDANALVAPGTPVVGFDDVSRRVTTTTSVERTALLALAGVVALAGLVMVGQALSRSVAAIEQDAEALQAIGFTRADLAAAGGLSHAVPAGISMAVAVVTAVLASTRFPVGLSGQVDPSRGIHVDWVVLVPGAVAVGGLMLGGAVVLARRRAGRGSSEVRSHPRGLVAGLRRATPVPVGLGTTMAFEPERGRRGVPVRPALVGAAVGVLGVIAAGTIAHGLDDSLAHPERAGVTYDATVFPAVGDPGSGSGGAGPPTDLLTPTGVSDAFVDSVQRVPVVQAASAYVRRVIDVGGTGVPTFSVAPKSGNITPTLVTGVEPRGPDEAAIGPATARQLGLRVGDTVDVGPQHRKVKLVGTALFPQDVHSTFDEGLWVTPDAMLAAAGPLDPVDVDSAYVAVKWKPGVDPEAAATQLSAALGPSASSVDQAELPTELTNLKGIRTLPLALAAFLVVLAVAAVGHVLAASVRRRNRDFAVYRALGFSRPMSWTVVGSQGTSIGLAGLVVGIPLGLVLGRLAWSWVAGRVPLQYASPITFTVVALVIPAAVVFAVLLAGLPGRRAGRVRPSDVLRAE